MEEEVKKEEKEEVKEEQQERNLEEEISLLREQLQEEKRISAEYLKTLQYLKADFENYKKRVLKEKKEMWDIVTENLILGLLPIVDNFERALVSISTSNDSNIKEILEGTNIIYRQLKEYLKELGVSEINAKNEMFNPDLHEAVIYEDSSEYPHGFILEEIQKGYKLKEKVIRPTKVKVVRNQSSQEKEPENVN